MGKRSVAPFGNDHGIFDAHAAETGQVNARLDGNDVPAGQDFLLSDGDMRLLM
jgi:hypothetical protein